MIKRTSDLRKIELFCDFHGHSKKKNAFMFGCSTFSYHQKPDDRFLERIFPVLLSKRNENFNFHDCSFAVQKNREQTARVVMCKSFNVVNSFTLETSFCGPSLGDFKDCHFTPNHFRVRQISSQEIGESFCLSLNDFNKA